MSGLNMGGIGISRVFRVQPRREVSPGNSQHSISPGAPMLRSANGFTVLRHNLIRSL